MKSRKPRMNFGCEACGRRRGGRLGAGTMFGFKERTRLNGCWDGSFFIGGSRLLGFILWWIKDWRSFLWRRDSALCTASVLGAFGREICQIGMAAAMQTEALLRKKTRKGARIVYFLDRKVQNP